MYLKPIPLSLSYVFLLNQRKPNHTRFPGVTEQNMKFY